MNAHMRELVKRFPSKLIKDDGRGNSYVPHSYIVQRLIEIYGEPPRIEVLRELYDGDKLTGVIMRLTVPGLEPVEEAGEADNPQSKTNGARAKDACSDAIKRCAMRLGLGLHLWAQENYYLDTLQDVQPDTSSPSDAPKPSALPPADTVGSDNLLSGASEPNADDSVHSEPESSASPPAYSDTVRALGAYISGDDTRRQIVQQAIRSAYKGLSLTPPTKLDTAEDYAACEEDILKDVLTDLNQKQQESMV